VPADVPDALFSAELTAEIARVLEENEAAIDLHASLTSLGMDSLKMHSLTGALQHRFGIVMSQEQLFSPATSVAWITANRAPLYQQRALEDGQVQPPSLPFVVGALHSSRRV
jgi:acyl carrier protein